MEKRIIGLNMDRSSALLFVVSQVMGCQRERERVMNK